MSDKKKLKIVVIGAGSKSFGRGAIADTLGCEELWPRDCTLSLVDIDEQALGRMYGIAKLLKEHYGSPMAIERTTERTEALPGADYVIMAVTVRRYPLWEQDYRVPMALGFRHVLGENGGPGALFHALRNFEIVVPICEDVARLCPHALVLNFTNPEGRIVMAIDRLTGAKCAGLCHGCFSCFRRTAEILGRPREELDMVTGGLNHFFWLLKVADRETGEDLYPELRRRILSDRDVEVPPLVRKMVEVFDHFTYPSDDHIGEYLAWAHEFTDGRWKYGQECRRVQPPGEEPEPEDWTEPYLSGKKKVDKWLARRSGELSVGIIAGIERDLGTWQPAVNVPNDGLYVENLPKSAVVEVPAIANAEGLQPQAVGPIPEPLAAISRTQVTIQELLVEGYRQRSRKLLLQALLLDPVIDSVRQAERLLSVMLELQGEFLPGFE